MTPILKHEHFADLDILNRLKLTGITRRKGEEHLFKKYFYYIHLGLKKYSITEDEIFDVYSDTILAVIESITKGSFKGNSSFKTIVYRIFHNRCVDVLRKKTTYRNKVHQSLELKDKQLNISNNSESVVEHIIKRTDKELFKQMLKQLCDKNQRLLLLAAEGFSDQQIAIAMNFKSRDVVKTSRLRCIRTLGQLIK
jgi:RNA polymerase sigma-70 factor (ECF subfamily)